MTREDVRSLISSIIEEPCPQDGEAVPMTSLQQLEFGFAIEEMLGFRHELPEDLKWNCVNDVVQWLEEKGELSDVN
jgi:acyl carrier protein